MTLYSLDILVDQQGKFWIGEMGGVRSGMKGFAEMYGDDRVEQKVLQMLQERYGKLTWNSGEYHYTLFRKEHPFQFFLEEKLGELLRPVFRRNVFWKRSEILMSDRAIDDWWHEPLIHGKKSSLDYIEKYRGQDSTVLNCLPQKLPHPSVNGYVTEQVAGNKFLQYELLRRTELKEHLPLTILVGCGWADGQGIAALAEISDFFVRKPLRAEQGRGVRVINKKGLLAFQEDAGPIEVLKPFSRYLFEFYFKRDLTSIVTFNDSYIILQKYLEEFAAENDFSFERGC